MVKKTHIRNYWMNQIFYQKSGSTKGLRILSSNFWPKIRKIHGAVTEISRVDGRTHFLSCGLTVGENCNVHKCTISTSRASLYNLKSNNQNRTNGQKSKFWKFLGIICLILHNYVIEPGNFWLWNGPKPSGISKSALSSNIKLSRSKNWSKIKILTFFMHN